MIRLAHVDVAVFGSGAAGLQAACSSAVEAPRHKTALFCPTSPLRGGSTVRSHAVNAALRPEDSVERHLEDTLRAGAGLNDPVLARMLVTEIPSRIADLRRWGCRFDIEGGVFAANTYGGSSISRGLRAKRMLGPEIARVLIRRSVVCGVGVHEGFRLADLIVEAGVVRGAVLWRPSTRRFYSLPCTAIVLATGGGTAMYSPSSAGPTKTCDGIALAYRHGAGLIDMEMVQFHPTGVVRPGRSPHGAIVPEEFRAQGAVLRNRAGDRITARPGRESPGVETRDVLSRAIAAEIEAGRGTAHGAVLLELGNLPTAVLAGLLARADPALARHVRSRRGSLEVAPTAHSLLGGIEISAEAATNIRGLYACGEDAGGTHGANRIGGNGLAEALVFGHVAGLQAARAAAATVRGLCRGVLPPAARRSSVLPVQKRLNRLRAAMSFGCGVVRRQDRLRELARAIDDSQAELDGVSAGLGQLDDFLDYSHLLAVSSLIVRASLDRDNNAGVFFKSENAGRGRYNIRLHHDKLRRQWRNS